MPGMNGSSISTYGILANSLYANLLLSLVIGILAALILTTGLRILGLDKASILVSKPISKTSSRTPSRREDFIRISFGAMWTIDGLFQLRPDMPGGFVQEVANPALHGAPGWINSIATPLLGLWNSHPVNVDIVTAWIQIFIGLGYILTTISPIRRAILYFSLAWSIVVLVVGNGLGIFYPGAAWITGAPSAIYVYGFAAVYLLAVDSEHAWTRTSKGIAYFLSLFLTVGALLQALPNEHYWSKGTLSSMAAAMAQAPQPHFISSSLALFAQLAQAQPIVVNSVLVALPAIAAIAIAVWPMKPTIIYWVAATEFIAWWLGMDFGIFSSTATDFNSGLPVVLLALAQLRPDRSLNFETTSRDPTTDGHPGVAFKARPHTLRLQLFWLTLCALVASVLVAILSFTGPASADMARVNSVEVSDSALRYVPNFALENYTGKVVAISALRGRPIVLLFLDLQHSRSSFLLAHEMVTANAQAGRGKSTIALLAISPTSQPGSTRTFTYSHHFDKFPNWYFLSGTSSRIERIWIDLGKQTQSTRPDGSSEFFFINKQGQISSRVKGSSSSQLEKSYESLLAEKMNQIL